MQTRVLVTQTRDSLRKVLKIGCGAGKWFEPVRLGSIGELIE
jgi:hypothetical protein